ncbi:MAG: hypothetical protein Q3972_06290 [Corynebacterium sp.]|nr:hypothetical protein [Corynebacterium sp.]
MFSKSLHSIAALGGAVAVLGASALFGAPAHALPPGGAGSDTPGTSSYVSPTTLKACDTISYSVSGFPAGEIVYIKIDDGSVSSGDPSIQGQGVVAQQRIDSSGTASGSFSLPCDLPAGEHWLRYLASENSSAGGTIGYTNSGNSTFTIVSASSNSDDSSSTTTAASSGGSNNSNRSAAVTQETVNAQGERVVVTRYVDEPAEAGAAAAAAGNNNNSGGSSGSTNSTNSTNAATLRLGGASSGSGSTGSGNAVTTDGGTVVVASGANGKPVIGLLVGGAILIVGLLAVGAYLHVNKPRTSRGGENGNF